MCENDVKIQIYMAADEEEYAKALSWVKEKEYGDTIKEVGHMDSTDLSGEHIDAYVFLFSVSNKSMNELIKYMNAPSVSLLEMWLKAYRAE